MSENIKHIVKLDKDQIKEMLTDSYLDGGAEGYLVALNEAVDLLQEFSVRLAKDGASRSVISAVEAAANIVKEKSKSDSKDIQELSKKIFTHLLR